MGRQVRDSTSIIIYYLLLVNTCCDIRLIVCDIHQMRQSSAVDFQINATELEQHIMNGLNMKKKPDVNLANISQDEFFTKYNEYLTKVNYRLRRSAKIYGDEITNIVYEDESESYKKIFAFKHSNQSNRVESHRRRRRSAMSGGQEEEIVSLDFEISDKSSLPTTIEEAVLNIFLTNSQNNLSEQFSTHGDGQTAEIDVESDYDDSSSGSDLSPKKLVLKSTSSKSHPHLRHHQQQSNSHSHKNRKDNNQNSNSIRLHVYEHESDSQTRVLLLQKDIKLPFNSNDYEKSKISYNQWIQLDVTSIVRTWLQGEDKVLSIDIYCEMCSKYGINIVNKRDGSNEASQKNNPALNVIGAVVRQKRKTTQEKQQQTTKKNKKDRKHKKTFCRHDGEKKCCRHKWIIDFKEMGGYEHIIHPRHFDAGFCEGTCPFRHNTGNNHAYFQSLAHHQLGKENVPNVCCAPTRLMDLEVLHLDEEDPTKLKVTTMKKMQAMRCSCT